jgi:hypothetical protein
MSVTVKHRISARRLADAADPYVAVANGEFVRAAEQAARLPAPAARLLLADLALRERRPQEAIELLTRWRFPADPAGDARRNLLLATAYERTGEHERAAALYALPLPRPDDTQLENQRLHFRALGCWMRAEHEEAEALLSRQRADGRLSYALGRDLLAWIDVAGRRYADAADRFVEALDAFALMDVPDQSARVGAVLGLAVTVVETIDLRHAQRLGEELDRIPWNDGTRKRLFHAGQ